MTDPFVQVFDADDRLTATLERMIELEAQLVQAVYDLGRAGKQSGDDQAAGAEKAEQASERLLNKAIQLNQAWELGGRVAQALGDIWDSTAGAAAEERQEIIQLSRALEQTLGDGYEQALAAAERFAAGQQAATLRTDSETRATVTSIARSLEGVVHSYEEIERIARVAQDVQQDLGAEASQVARQIAQGVGGQERALRELLGPTHELLDALPQMVNEGERLEAILLALEDRFGGAATEIDSQILATNSLGDAWDDLKESIGGVGQQLTPILAELATGLANVGDATSGVIEGVELYYDGTALAGDSIQEMLEQLDQLEQGMQSLEDAGYANTDLYRLWSDLSQTLRLDIDDLAASVGIARGGPAGDGGGLTGAIDSAADATKELTAEMRLLAAEVKAAQLEAEARVAEQEAREAERRAEQRRREREQELEEEHRYHDILIEESLAWQEEQEELRIAAAERNVEIAQEFFAVEEEMARDQAERLTQVEIDMAMKIREAQLSRRAAERQSEEAAEASRVAALKSLSSFGQAVGGKIGAAAVFKALDEYGDAASEFAEVASSFAAGDPWGVVAHTAAAFEHIAAAHTHEATASRGGAGGGGGARAGGGGGQGGPPPTPDRASMAAPARSSEERGLSGAMFAIIQVDGDELGRVVTKSQRRYADFNSGDTLPASFVSG